MSFARVVNRRWVRPMFSLMVGKKRICTYDDKKDLDESAETINAAVKPLEAERDGLRERVKELEDGCSAHVQKAKDTFNKASKIQIHVCEEQEKTINALRAEVAELRKHHIAPSEISSELSAKDILDGDHEMKRLHIFNLQSKIKGLEAEVAALKAGEKNAVEEAVKAQREKDARIARETCCEMGEHVSALILSVEEPGDE